MPHEQTAFVSDDGEIIVQPALSFQRDAWLTIRRVLKKFKLVHGLDAVSDETAIEMIVVDLGGRIGFSEIKELPTHYVNISAEKAKLEKRVDKSAAMRIYFHERLSDGTHQFRIRNPINDHMHDVKWHDGWLCDCADHQFRREMCKHIAAAQRHLSIMAALKDEDHGRKEED